MPLDVLIAGSGPGALEAALALRRQAGDLVRTTLLTPAADLTYRPLSVLAPFAAGEATAYPIHRIAADARLKLHSGRLAQVDVDRHVVLTGAGERLPYDVLLVAIGARAVTPFPGATVFAGSPADQERLHGIVQDVELGYLRKLAFVVPEGTTWPLPLYELALMLAARADDMCIAAELHLVTPEPGPLAFFGAQASREVAALLAGAGIELHAASRAEVVAPRRLELGPAGERLDVDRVITLPRLKGPHVAGLPADRDGFLPVDGHARVRGAADVYAAGDATSFPLKQGGIACQQADAAAAHIARRAGADVDAEPFTTVLRGILLTERWARFIRREPGGSSVAGRALWWPPTKVAGRELAAYLEELDDEAGRRSGMPVNVDVGDAGTRSIEVLGLH